ncbi:RagB/SusD family nutrient uptake outer membrane protein [Parabacteroides goldsteinii]|uniref:RagB/SusD family nutrient uptake outer membrane protein n=1 Tax=Parabacteroides goldsteinii TaxID=328812 RepID=UPI00101C4E30|nr:RagB/SusD family nutrient uptake outer membrane protein [Parabacteroides goldsteinii]
MNIYRKIGFSSLLGLGLMVSCDVMDTKPFETYSEELVWSSKEMVDAFVIQTYPSTLGYFSGGSASWESLTPNGTQCDQVGNSINTTATETGISASSDYGFGRFSEQRRCNMILEKVAESTVLTELQKKELMAEGHFLRGALYFDMTRKMGRFVPIDHVLSPDDSEAFKTPLTSSIEESYQLVMGDLDKAVEGLPETSDEGRANKYVALALRSRAALQAYAYTKDKKYLDVAINSANEVINSGAYTLTDNYGGMFSSDQAPSDKEIIMARYYLDKDASVGSFEEMILALPNLPGDDVMNGSSDGVNTLDPTIKTFDGWGMYWPTQDLVDQYLVLDEKTGEAKVWYETSQYLDNVEAIPSERLNVGSVEEFERFDGEIRNLPTANDLLTGRTDYPLFKQVGKLKSNSNRTITDIMYNNRDKRMDATIIRDMSEFWGLTMTLNLGGNASQGIRSKEDGGWYTTTTGYYWRKNMVKPDPRAFVSVKINFHYIIARLGEMYMNLAEAYLLKGDVAKAVEMLNVTRMKHGGLPASKASTLDDAWTDYMRERRVEMAYENGDIYFSYLRWGKYGGACNYGRASGDVIKDLNSPVYKIGISSDRKSFCVGQLTLLNSWNRNFTTRRYLFPIPQGAIDKRAADGIVDKQNEGW